MADLRIGISGWTYPSWRGVFYPTGLPQRRELEYASRRMSSIEINGTFYSLQRPERFELWFRQSPDDFLFAVKGSQFITHMKRLRDARAALGNFFASGLLALRHKLGPILWQLPRNFAFDEPLLSEFLAVLPRDTVQLAELGTAYDHRLKAPPYLEVDAPRPVRHALEIRHPSFLCEALVRLLRSHGVALVLADTAGLWPYTEDLTADFVYARLHGSTEIYASGYSESELAWWADRIRLWQRGRAATGAPQVAPAQRGVRARDVYVYFDNDAKVRAPFDAMALSALLGVEADDEGAREIERDAAATRRVTSRRSTEAGAHP